MNNDGMEDRHDLERFVDAQDRIYAQALAEIRSGRKESHWMWFVFPQLAGLGSSWTAQRYAIGGVAEAEAYLRHPVHGPRLQECFAALLGVNGRTAHQIFGSPDDWKLRSCATLFGRVAGEGSVFEKVLARYFDGAADPRTLDLLDRPN